ncbi:hypothetical protein FRB95_009754 [Tulasnella sp. JGI-2019a]|nr:hypothetical protein FRB95_009754 [Tulasnella sp. JGI-2019a]
MAGRVKIQATKIWADGSTQGFTAALNQPYLNKPNDCGTLNMSDAEMEELMRSRISRGRQIMVHSNGDRATDQTLRSYAKVLKELPNRDPKIMHRIEHFTVTEPRQLKTAYDLGLGVTHLIGHVNYWGEAFKTWVLGAERADRLDPVKEDLDNDLVYSFHSDSPVTEVDPLQYVQTAVTRQLNNILPPTILGPGQCVELIAALRGITLNPAKQVLMADMIGSLGVGKAADLVIIEQDPREVDKGKLGSIEVLETWLEGRKVDNEEVKTG